MSDLDCQARMRCYFSVSGNHDGQCLCIKRTLFGGPTCGKAPMAVLFIQLLIVIYLQRCTNLSVSLTHSKYMSWKQTQRVSSSQHSRGPPLSLASLGWTSLSYALLTANMSVLLVRMVMAGTTETRAVSVEIFLARKASPVLLNFGVLCALLALLVTAIYWYENYVLVSRPLSSNSAWSARQRKLVFAFPALYYAFFVLFYFLTEWKRALLNICLMLCAMLVALFYGWGGVHLSRALYRISQSPSPSHHRQALKQLKSATHLILWQTGLAFALATFNLITDSLYDIPDFLHYVIPSMFHLVLARILNTSLKYAASIELLSRGQMLAMDWCGGCLKILWQLILSPSARWGGGSIAAVLPVENQEEQRQEANSGHASKIFLHTTDIRRIPPETLKAKKKKTAVLLAAVAERKESLSASDLSSVYK